MLVKNGFIFPKFWGENINIFENHHLVLGFPIVLWFQRLLGETNISMRLLGWVKHSRLVGMMNTLKLGWVGRGAGPKILQKTWKLMAMDLSIAAESTGPFQILTLYLAEIFLSPFPSIQNWLFRVPGSYHGILVCPDRARGKGNMKNIFTKISHFNGKTTCHRHMALQ